MSTIHQRIKLNFNTNNINKPKLGKALEGNPILKGICIKVLIIKPKKPNSARRKIAYIKLSNGNYIYAYIPGIGHNLQEHSVVFIREGRIQDCPAVHYKCLRGKGQLLRVLNRKTSLSKY